MQEKMKCWDFFQCDEKECPVFELKEPNCWLISGTHCRDEIQGKFLEKIEMCLECKPFKTNIGLSSLEGTLKVVHQQFTEFRRMVDDRDRELEEISLELAIGLSEVFETLKRISSGDPDVRMPEASELELISKLKHMVNLTAENLGEIVNLSHEFAIGLAEHFGTLHRVSTGDLDARVAGPSEVELLGALKNVTNDMIESVSREIGERERAEEALQEAHDKLEIRVQQRTAELTRANELLKKEIAERKRVEEALRESEEKYRSLVESTDNSIYLIDKDLKYLFMNNRHLARLGLPIDRVVGEAYADFHSKQESRRFSAKVNVVFEKGKSVWQEYRSRRDGQYFLRTLSPVMEPEGTIKAVTVISKDITERKQAEKALRESEKKYRRLFATVPDAVMIFDTETRSFIDLNESAEQLYGYSKRELRKLRYDDITVDPEDSNALIAQTLTENIGKGFMLYHKRKDEHVFPVEISASTFDLAGRNVICVLVRDITKRIQVEEELTKSREQLRNLSAYLQSAREQERTSIAREVHDDLGQSLTALKMDVSWLNKKLPEDKDSLIGKTESMMNLIDRTIQSVKRISSELRPGLLDDLGLTAALEWQAKEFEGHTGINCDINLGPEDVDVDQIAAIAIFRIFQETLTNVARHANATDVKITLAEKGKYLVLTVKDNGKGITRAETWNSKSFGLIGMRERALTLRGDVDISGKPNLGTILTLTVPMENQNPSQEPF